MIYWDTSALVKLYIHEKGSETAQQFISQKGINGINCIGKVEMVAAVNRLIRMNVIDQSQGESIRNEFSSDWPSYLRFDITSTLINKACELAWREHLCGYDAIHLASAVTWQESVTNKVNLYTYDQELQQAARNVGLSVLPVAT